MNSEPDVLIFGDGPAGCAAAIDLLKRGYTVTQIESPQKPRGPSIESLPPEIARPLAELGLWDKFLRAGFAKSSGVVSQWGSNQCEEYDYIFNPNGCGWHVQREKFATWFRDAASNAGAEFRRHDLIASAKRSSDRWQIVAQSPDGTHRLAPRFVIDATGRRSKWSRRQGATRHCHDFLTAVLCCFDNRPGTSLADRRLWIEAASNGWWYSSPTDHQLVLGFVSDADIVRDLYVSEPSHWLALAQQTQLQSARLPSRAMPSPLIIINAQTGCLSPSIGDGWLAIGDAALTFDPLSGQGVCQAIGIARRGATAVSGHLRGERDALMAYGEWLTRLHRDNLKNRSSHYARETRWRDLLFWKRRR